MNDVNDADDQGSFSETVVVEKKPTSGFAKIVWVMALLLVLGVVGYYTLRAFNRPVPKTPAPLAALPSTPSVSVPTVAGPSVAPPSADPLDTLTAPAPGISGGVDPAAGPTVQPSDPLAPETANVAPAADPLASLGAPGPTMAGPSPPSPSVSATSQAQPAPATGALNSDLALQVGQAVTEAIRPMETRINARFDTLEKRVGTLEGAGPRPSAAASTPSPRAETPVSTGKRVAHRSAARKTTPVARPKAVPANRIELLPTVAPDVAITASTRPSAETSGEASEACRLGAVLPGRAWIKRADGSFETYGVGDTLPDGKVVSAISPEKGIQVGGQRWACR